ncbi:HK97 gp10 family phage protein [Brevibacillus massiliensis]|uniref:HK97 gp10 family phage protein n=1 Tax=Brevibacillus massiliensis TaxID=1118054 RepID=UPI0002F052F4|nr:HK97 gp10 family phage protein [Brevibacillus massiliensis]
MAKWGKFDFGDFKKLAGAFQKTLDERVIERFIRDFLMEMAMRSIRKIKKRTPVNTGELRNSWQIGQVAKKGDAYEIEIFNNTHYALTKWGI